MTYSHHPVGNPDLLSSGIGFPGQELHVGDGSVCPFLSGPLSCSQLHSSPHPSGPGLPSRLWPQIGLLVGMPASALENFVR